MKTLKVTVTNTNKVQSVVAADDNNTAILKELSKVLKTAMRSDESKTLSVRTRKKCLSLEYKGCTFYVVRNIQELKEEQQSKNSYTETKNSSTLKTKNGTIRYQGK
jgi:hypothetical protein